MKKGHRFTASPAEGTVAAQLLTAYLASPRSLEAIAADSGFSESNVRTILRGENARLASVLALAAVLGVTTLTVPISPRKLRLR